MTEPSFAELDNTLKNGEEFEPTEAELKECEFQSLKYWTNGMMRKDGSNPAYCPKTQIYRYQNVFWRDNYKPHYFRAVPLGTPENKPRQERRQVAAAIESCVEEIRQLLQACRELRETDLFDDTAAIVKLIRLQLENK